MDVSSNWGHSRRMPSFQRCKDTTLTNRELGFAGSKTRVSNVGVMEVAFVDGDTPQTIFDVHAIFKVIDEWSWSFLIPWRVDGLTT